MTNFFEKQKALAGSATKGPLKEYEKFPQSIAREYEILAPGGGILFRSTSYGKMKEDSEYIVFAVNTHAKVCELLGECLRRLEEACECIPSLPPCGRCRSRFKIQTELEKLGGEG